MRSTFTLILAVLATLTGCANSIQQHSTADYEATSQIGRKKLDDSRQAALDTEAQRVAAQTVARPWVAGLSKPLSKEVNLPAPLRQSLPTTVLFGNEPVELSVALRQLSQSTGIVVTATPDAYLPAAAFGPKIGGGQAGGGANSGTIRVSLRATQVPLWKLLDDLATQMGCQWRPTAQGAEFYRVETTVYELVAVDDTANSQAGLGRSGSGSNGFSSDGKTTYEFKSAKQFEGLKATVEALLSQSGKSVLSPESGTMVVTDTPEVQKRVAAFIERQNKAHSRRIRLWVEEVEFVSTRQQDFGMDWTLAFNTTRQALSSSPVANLAGINDGSLTLAQPYGPFAGSSLVVKALNEVGTVVNHRVFSLITTSGKPATTAMRTTFNYVDQTSTGSSSATAGGVLAQAPTITQKDETVGTFLTVVPTAKADGSVHVVVTMDKTVADPLKTFTAASSGGSVSVQQKTINGSGSIQEVLLRSGRTELVTGYDQNDSQDTTRRLGEDVPLVAGGSKSSGHQNTVRLLLLTARTEEGV